MDDLRFPAPMKIKTGDEASSRDVVTLQDACEILIDWPQAKRGDFYRAARDAVVAAMKRTGTPAQAQEVFVAFCNHVGILVRR